MPRLLVIAYLSNMSVASDWLKTIRMTDEKQRFLRKAITMNTKVSNQERERIQNLTHVVLNTYIAFTCKSESFLLQVDMYVMY